MQQEGCSVCCSCEAGDAGDGAAGDSDRCTQHGQLCGDDQEPAFGDMQPQVEGNLTKILVRSGDAVKAGGC